MRPSPADFYPRPPRGGRRRHPAGHPHRVSISIHALREEGDRGGCRGSRCRTISIHALREEGDQAGKRLLYLREEISIHALREEGDCSATARAAPSENFYPRPPRGGRPRRGQRAAPHRRDFYPRPPRGGRRKDFETESVFFSFLSTPSARRATRHLQHRGRHQRISIHALREEGDATPSSARTTPGTISIHALREEGDLPFCDFIVPYF